MANKKTGALARAGPRSRSALLGKTGSLILDRPESHPAFLASSSVPHSRAFRESGERPNARALLGAGTAVGPASPPPQPATTKEAATSSLRGNIFIEFSFRAERSDRNDSVGVRADHFIALNGAELAVDTDIEVGVHGAAHAIGLLEEATTAVAHQEVGTARMERNGSRIARAAGSRDC